MKQFPEQPGGAPFKLGVVSFLNSRPLVDGLDREAGVCLRYAVPSALPNLLREGQVDVALIPVIDLSRSAGAWQRVSDACIGSDGPTMTVRVFSRVPPEQMSALYVDADSHTSVVLARLIWTRHFKRQLRIAPLASVKNADECESVLLIGDKVVTGPVGGCPYQIDLGEAWKKWTGLPFVFAVWAAPAEMDAGRLAGLADLLESARDRGVARAAAIADQFGPPRGWPVELAREYLRERLMFKVDALAAKGMELFWRMAAEEDAFTQPPPDAGSRSPASSHPTHPLAGSSSPPLPHGCGSAQVNGRGSAHSSAGLSSRLSEADALSLYTDCSIHELGRRAFAFSQQLHPEDYRTYVVDRNINYSNCCTAQCAFCNFKAAPPGGYVLSLEEIAAKIQELVDIGGTQVLMQGGLAPPELLPFEWYLDLLRFIKREFPKIHLHAFSPPEIWAFHKVFGMALGDVLLRLREAGLDTIPGGGAEILVDRVRDRISPGKTRSNEYLEVMRQAHRIGMRTTITMMFGHIETIPERIEHLRRIRDLQEETGGFTAFICWTFQPENTPLGRLNQLPADSPAPPDGEHLKLAGAHDYLKTLAVARLFLDNVPNVQASWVTQGPKIGQLALFFGANDMGSVMMEENVVSAAGTTYRLSEQDIRRLIADAGWRPQKRNCYYQPVD